MKKILITGKNSYIGTSFEKWVNRFPNDYLVNTISTFGDDWKSVDFSKYDVVFNVAGIAHVKPKPALEQLFYKVNRDLAIELCKKAKKEGISQFIFLSSSNVFGDTNEVITEYTIPTTNNYYGKSKLQADEVIQKLSCETFKVVSVRPPVVYGANCKGNFTKLSKYARLLPLFPDYINKKSMIYIDNLCEFIRLIIENSEKGIFYPQNKEYTSTTDLVKIIATVNGRKIITTKIFNPVIKFLINKVRIINKIFSDDLYDKKLSDYKNFSYCVVDFKESIIQIENSKNKDF